jgi:hypothetical protein
MDEDFERQIPKRKTYLNVHNVVPNRTKLDSTSSAFCYICNTRGHSVEECKRFKGISIKDKFESLKRMDFVIHA